MPKGLNGARRRPLPGRGRRVHTLVTSAGDNCYDSTAREDWEPHADQAGRRHQERGDHAAALYLDRRAFMPAGSSRARRRWPPCRAGVAGPRRRPPGQPLRPPATRPSITCPDAHDQVPGRDHLQQLLRVRHQQGRPGAPRGHAQAAPVEGAGGRACAQAATFDVDDILKMAPLEERVYRLRCVEGWSMVIPWIGFPLSALLKRVEPTSQAKYVEFTTLVDPEQFPGQKKGLLQLRRPRLALHRGAAPRRGAAPADPAHGRHVRPGAAEPERRADPRGHPVEVRLQERQVHRAHPAHRRASRRRRGTRRRRRSTASTPT